MPATPQKNTSPSIAIIGSGFGGLGMAYYLKRAGFEHFTLFEKAQGLGGVWRENTYPGAACDVASHLYSFSFEPCYPWQYRYGKQPEILAYQHFVAEKYGLNQHLKLGAQLERAHFDEARALWCLEFADGSRHEAQVLITAMGQLHRPALPKIKGLEKFSGPSFHSAEWRHDVALTGKTIGVIGSGASAVQFVPEIAPTAQRLKLFQRSNSWVIPKGDRRYRAWERRLLKALPSLHILDRLRIFWTYEFLASALQPQRMLSIPAGAIIRTGAKVLARWHIKNPALRKQLAPDGPVGCKRMLLSNDWLKTLARPNVDVISTAITEVTAEGIKTADGIEHQVDVLIYGTGFAATDFLAPVNIIGPGGAHLQEHWRDGAQAYLGLGVAGFPNLFTLYGPNTNLGAGSIIFMLERQQRYLTQVLQAMQEKGWKQVQPKAEAQLRYNQHLQAKSASSPFQAGCHSWYINAQGRNTNNWVGWMSEYALSVKQPQWTDFETR